MKTNMTKIIVSAVFGLMISSTAIASEEDYGDDIFVSSSNTHEVYISTVAFNKMDNDEISVLDINYSSNE